MKLKYFKTPTPKYKKYNVSELISFLGKAKKSREKVPILINLSLLNQSDYPSELLSCLLQEVVNKINTRTREFGTLTVSMIAAIAIIQLDIDAAPDLRKAIYKNWPTEQINDFSYILKSEGFDVECWFGNPNKL